MRKAKPKIEPTADKLEALRKQARDGMRRKRADDRDIHIEPYSPSERRLAGGESLRAFISLYLPHRFSAPMSDDHEAAIERLEVAIRTGGQFAQACPRGDGKTERAIAGALWAFLYGLRHYIVAIGADLGQAKQILSEIHNEIGDNDAIAEAWPELASCVRGMDGNANAGRYLTINGEPARFVGGKGKLVYPHCPVAPGNLSGHVIEARGLTGSLRGMRHTPKGGTTIRPDLAIIDDPQTDESAASYEQVLTREALINGAIMGMAGPRKKIAAVCNCTVIRHGDLADRLLDQRRHPEWRGVRFRMVYDWPARRDMWDEYVSMRRDGLRNGDRGAAAHAYYLEHRALMDAGARVGWSHRFREGEVSAIQCAWNLIADHGEDMFLSEYQNEPRENKGGLWRLTPEQVGANLNGLKRGVCPADTTVLSLGADLNIERGVNWVVTAWGPETAGAVVDYGRFPGGSSPLWSPQGSYTEEQAIFSGLQAVMDDVLYNRQYMREGTRERVFVTCAGFDCGYKPETVFSAVRSARTKYGTCQLYPIRGVGGKSYGPRQAITKGDGWHVAQYGTSRCNTLFFNTDKWRERTQRSFLLPAGCPGGSLALWGSEPGAHVEFANQFTAERIVDVLHGDKLQTVYVWHLEPGRANDLLDAVVYSIVGAGRAGIRFGEPANPKARGAKVDPISPGPADNYVPPMPAQAPAKQPARPYRHASAHKPGGFATRW